MKDIQAKIEKAIPHDKALHHIGCEHIQTLVIIAFIWWLGLWSIPLGWTVCFVMQLCKEYFKDRHATDFSWVDIAYGMSGCVPLSVIAIVLMVFK